MTITLYSLVGTDWFYSSLALVGTILVARTIWRVINGG